MDHLALHFLKIIPLYLSSVPLIPQAKCCFSMLSRTSRTVQIQSQGFQISPEQILGGVHPLKRPLQVSTVVSHGSQML
jgi:hypothetical protein